jgi:hypothetical protein
MYIKYLNNSVYTVLNIERGRYIKLPVEKRICPLCNIEPEDEIHFILKCPKLDECRKELFSNISSVVPSFNDMDEFQKFKFIISSFIRIISHCTQQCHSMYIKIFK